MTLTETRLSAKQADRPVQVPEFVVGADFRPNLETDPRARTSHSRLLRVLNHDRFPG